jgi:hypothetical protein
VFLTETHDENPIVEAEVTVSISFRRDSQYDKKRAETGEGRVNSPSKPRKVAEGR